MELKNRFVLIDFIRWFLASYVIFFHFFVWSRDDIFWSSHPIFNVLQYGYLSVDNFFVISGLAIAASSAAKPPLQFTILRLRRLIPAFLFVSVLETILVIILFNRKVRGESGFEVAVNSLNNLLPTSGQDSQLRNFVAWSLSVEIQYYLLVLIALIFCKYTGRSTNNSSQLVFSRVLIFLLYAIGLLNLKSRLEIPIFLYLPYFILGTFIYLFSKRKVSEAKMKHIDYLALIPLLTQTLVTRTTNVHPTYSTNFALLFVVVVIVLIFVSYRSKFSAQIGFYELIGSGSYALYLVGGFFGTTLFVQIENQLGLPISIVFSYLTCSSIALTYQKFVDYRFGNLLFGKYLKN